MKAVTQACVKTAVPELGIRQDSCKIVKTKTDETTAEMQACFHKLKDLVPSIPQNKKLSKTALLQHVIDYILDLEVALEFHPAVLGALPSIPSSCRSPLSEKSEPNNVLAEICCMQDEEMCESRPISK